ESGGRVFASDWMFSFLYQNGNFATAATWSHQSTAPSGPYTIDQVSNPAGKAFDTWLENVGVSAKGSGQIATISPAYPNTTGVSGQTQQWLYWGSPAQPLHFAFNTPVGASSANQCGRVVFSDWHSTGVSDASLSSHGKTFPTECAPGPMTAQEAILEYTLFD